MGYYVRLERAHFVIPCRNLGKAYDRMCRLNRFDELKGGGDSEGGKWFAWLDKNYPRTCKDAEAILKDLRFEVDEEENGDLQIIGFDAKTGDEQYFLEAIADLVRPDSFLEWTGEEGRHWRQEFNVTGGASYLEKVPPDSMDWTVVAEGSGVLERVMETYGKEIQEA